MTNERIIFNEVCTHYDALQRHDLASRFYTAEQVERYAAGLKFEPDSNGNTPDPVEAAEAFLCSKLFHTWAEWHKEGLTVKKGEKAAITCELWKLSDKKKQPKPDADELTKAAAEQDKGYYYLAKAHLFHRGQVEKQQPRPVGRFKSLDDIQAYNKMLADQRKAAKAAAQQDKPQTEKAEAPAPVIIEEHHELPELVHADPLPTKKATKRTAKKAPAKKAETKPAGPDMEELKNAFVKNYSRLYQTDDDHESGEFYDAVDKFDEMSTNNAQFAATVQKFNKYMGDLISSDREAAAFVMALDDLEKSTIPEMVPGVQQLCFA